MEIKTFVDNFIIKYREAGDKIAFYSQVDSKCLNQMRPLIMYDNHVGLSDVEFMIYLDEKHITNEEYELVKVKGFLFGLYEAFKGNIINLERANDLLS